MDTCLMCSESFDLTDQPVPVGTEDGPRDAHRECLLLNTVGHTFGVCSCTGFGTDHAAAEELLRRVRMADFNESYRPQIGTP